MQQVCAVKHGNDLHVLRQDSVVEFIHLLMDRIQRRLRIGSLA